VVNKNNKEEPVESLYELLHVLEFDPNRKRMSVIVRDLETNRYVLYCKGADNSIFDKSIGQDQQIYNNCLKSFSENGWRTLVLSYKLLSLEEYLKIDKLIFEASSDLSNKQDKLTSAYEMVENNLQLIGVTAVEDKLQADVDVTLEALRLAGIVVWVLTGDKLETAINISESCKHFTNDMIKFVLANMSLFNDINEKLNYIMEQ
jgi:phospholipid-translocating ATPase